MNRAPDPVCTERLVLRAPQAADAAAIAGSMSPEVSQWLASWPPKLDCAGVRERIADAWGDIEAGRALHWLIENRLGSRPIGWIRISRSEHDATRGELGFWLVTPFHGCGYAIEAVAAAIQEGFRVLDLDVIEGGAQPANHASLRVMERVGMVRTIERQVFASARQKTELCIFCEIRRPRGSRPRDTSTD